MQTREAVFCYVRDFIATNGYSPTYREIASGVGLKSWNTVAYHVAVLVDLGRLSQSGPRSARTLRVVHGGTR